MKFLKRREVTMILSGAYHLFDPVISGDIGRINSEHSLLPPRLPIYFITQPDSPTRCPLVKRSGIIEKRTHNAIG
jgi:hypothetical protein